jgi:hypothetical protein
MAQRRRSPRSHLIEALLVLLAVLGIYAFISSGAVDHTGRWLAGMFATTREPPAPAVQIVDGFPIGDSVPCAQHCAEWTTLARAALDQREHRHVEVVGIRTFMEGHIPDLYGPGVLYARSGTLIVVLFDLPDGSVRATGVYCGVGGCRGFAEYPK